MYSPAPYGGMPVAQGGVVMDSQAVTPARY